MKKLKIIPIIIFIGGFICGLTYITYAGTYNSEEISYDNSNSHAEAENVKDAIDWLYTNAGMKNECPEDMTCIESPVVTINSSGPGSVNKEIIHVRINGNNKFIVTPDSGFTLNSIICTEGYSLSSFKTLSSEAMNSQEIIVTNENVNMPGTCEVKFSTNEITISSPRYTEPGIVSYNSDNCNSAGEGCVCWYIKNGGSDFTYGSHTGCNFKSKNCKYTSYDNASSFDCSYLNWYRFIDRYESLYESWRNVNISWNSHLENGKFATCSGVITCAT